MKKVNNESGFTLIELILVIAILGILAVAAAPTFTNLLTNTSRTGGAGTGGAIQSGINVSYSESVAAGAAAWPTTLDGASNAACSVSNPCFGTVIQPPIVSSAWTRTSDTVYTYSANGITQTWTYTPGTGAFVCSGADC